MSKSAQYEFVLKEMQKAQLGSADGQGVFWAAVDGIAAAIDGATGAPFASIGSTSVQGLFSAASKAPSATANPLFVGNGHDECNIKYSQSYFRHRKYKGLGGGAISIAGAAGSLVTQVDVAGILQHGNATGSTAVHLAKLKAIAKSGKRSETITEWVDLLIKMKAIKGGVRGSQLAGAAIPVGGLGIAVGAVAAAAKIGVTMTLTKACLATSAQIHWRAFQEQVFSGAFTGSTGAVGPASKMIHEIFTRRGATRIFGQYNVAKIIKEPTGWLMLNDKLMLI